ncbi:MAG: YggS family pyridoxal phosphate-dependent enzyme [Alphaproteobacteria bacterium]|nr:YggS family pyridoxal phosphate-dependent enzyme [Alphaproteobacteria bacterium]
MAEILTSLLQTIERARAHAPLAATQVTLVAVSKGQPPERIETLLAAGHRHFGENRVQEAQSKWLALLERYPGTRLHLIGPLQRNKAKAALRLFHAIHSIDRASLAETLAEEMARLDRPVECFVQVNTGEEPQKAGVAPREADALIAQCRRLNLPLAGLMCVPPADVPPAPHFALLRQLAQAHGLSGLSMGMSADFETAIRFGATHVRVGTALFGKREETGQA